MLTPSRTSRNANQLATGWWSVADVASILGVSQYTIRKLTKAGTR